MSASIGPAAIVAAALLASGSAFAAGADAVVRTDHVVVVRSIAPALQGKDAKLYLREVKSAAAGKTKGVVLFVHGATAPGEVSFDPPYQDYSWMAYLARAGFDVFSVDMEGYGRSQRPPPMADPCNLSPAAQKSVNHAPCAATWTQPITTMSSDWNDIGATVDYLLAQRHVKTVALAAWSQGGARAAGYTARNPDKVSRLVLLGPGYDRAMPTTQPDPLPTPAAVMTAQTEAEFRAGWDRQAPCPGQYDPGVAASVWSEMLRSDPVGAAWGPGVRRTPSVPNWGFNAEVVAKMTTPVLMVSGENDKQIVPDRVRALYADLGSIDKVFIDLACSSHNAMWEKNHLLLFKASADWLTMGKVNGVSSGMLRAGY